MGAVKKLYSVEKTIDFREADFKKEVYSLNYPFQILKEFYDYWSEKNKSGTKMRWELEKTWDLGRRLARWARNSKVEAKHIEQKEAVKPVTIEDWFNDMLLKYKSAQLNMLPIQTWVVMYDKLKEGGKMILRSDQWVELKKNFGHNPESGKKEAVKLLFTKMILSGEHF